MKFFSRWEERNANAREVKYLFTGRTIPILGIGNLKLLTQWLQYCWSTEIILQKDNLPLFRQEISCNNNSDRNRSNRTKWFDPVILFGTLKCVSNFEFHHKEA